MLRTRLSSSTGQVAAEYVGGLLLVAVVIGALLGGQVHIKNSGIPNHAYYLMVKAIGRDHAEAIVYRALTEELEPDSGFEDFRTASLEVARRLWGEDSPEYRGTNESFAAVGLDGTWEAPEVEGC